MLPSQVSTKNNIYIKDFIYININIYTLDGNLIILLLFSMEIR